MDLARLDPDDTLHQRDTDACCDIRKVAPLDRALRRWPVSITGRKRFQAATRAALEVFEADGERLKVNPLAHWSAQDLRDYMDAHDLPRHPLVAQGLPVDRLLAVHHAGAPRARTSGPGAGAAARRSSAASISARTAASCARRAEGRAMTVLVTEAGFAPDDWAGGGPAVRRLLERAGPAGGGAGGRVPERPRPGRARALARPAGADPGRLPGDGATGAASRSPGGCGRWAMPAGCARPGR